MAGSGLLSGKEYANHLNDPWGMALPAQTFWVLPGGFTPAICVCPFLEPCPGGHLQSLFTPRAAG